MPPAVQTARAADALPAVLVVFCAFDAGGFFADTVAKLCCALLVGLAFRVAVVPRPFAGFGRAAIVGAALLGLLLGLTALSALWSDAPARAALEADRVLLYGLTFVVMAAAPWRPGRLSALARWLAAACVVVCAAALLSRLLPTIWPTHRTFQPQRLSYPLTYWNALALLAALGLVLCVHLAAGAGERRAVRVMAAGALPVLATTALLTFSRGGLAVALVAVGAFALLARPPHLLRVAVAAVPSTAVAAAAAYGASSLAGAPAGEVTRDGARVLAVVLAAALVSAVAVARLPDDLTARAGRLRARVPRRLRRAAAAVAVLALVAAAVQLAVRQVEGFSGAPDARAGTDQRRRLLDPSSNGRTEYWRAALVAFGDRPILGGGAGTYQLTWWRVRRSAAVVTHAHSLQLEALAELGIAGLTLLLAALAVVLAGLWRRRRGPDGPAATALAVAGGAWVLHAALDWDWQMPAVTIWLWAAGGAAVAAGTGAAPVRGRRPALAARAAIAAALLAAAAAPALLAFSEHRIDGALEAYRDGDCDTTARLAREADAAFPLRPEPVALQGLCAARAGDGDGARTLLDEAVARDPHDWAWRYDRALVRAVAGGDPTGDLRAAATANPLAPQIAAARAGLAARRTRRAAAAVAPPVMRGTDVPPIGGTS